MKLLKKRIDRLEGNKKFALGIQSNKYDVGITRGNGSCNSWLPSECLKSFVDKFVDFIDSEIEKAKKEMEEI